MPKGQIDPDLLIDLDRAFTETQPAAGRRDLLRAAPITQRLLDDPWLNNLTQEIFARPAFVVRATLFDKQPTANWSVTWHQDQAIAVQAKHPIDGYGPWSIKNSVQHVEPPLEILKNITSIRLHLEDCTIDHGPLVVSPGTHRQGRLLGEDISRVVDRHGEEACCLRAGSVLIMKPLTLHRSSKMRGGLRRRVIHLDCTDQELPEPLAWKYREAFQQN